MKIASSPPGGWRSSGITKLLWGGGTLVLLNTITARTDTLPWALFLPLMVAVSATLAPTAIALLRFLFGIRFPGRPVRVWGVTAAVVLAGLSFGHWTDGVAAPHRSARAISASVRP